jgi:hypothetical protein
MVGLSVAAGATVAFTDAADAVTTAGFAVLAAVGLAAPRGRWEVPPAAGARWPWAALAVLVVAMELGMFFAGIGGLRASDPTLSWLADRLGRWCPVGRWRPGRALLFAAWLALGWVLCWPGPAGQVPSEGTERPDPVTSGTPAPVSSERRP